MGQIAPIKNMMQMVRSAANPQMALQQMMANNPQYAQLQSIINANGGDAQKAFYAQAKQLGVNGDEIINMLK